MPPGQGEKTLSWLVGAIASILLVKDSSLPHVRLDKGPMYNGRLSFAEHATFLWMLTKLDRANLSLQCSAKELSKNRQRRRNFPINCGQARGLKALHSGRNSGQVPHHHEGQDETDANLAMEPLISVVFASCLGRLQCACNVDACTVKNCSGGTMLLTHRPLVEAKWSLMVIK